MTDLQLSLILGGGVFIVGVFSYNKWQESKARKSVQRAFASDHDDVLMRPDDLEPGLEPDRQQEPTLTARPGSKSDDKARPDQHDDARHEPSFDAAPGSGSAAEADAQAAQGVSAAVELANSLVDPLIDCLLPLALDAPVRGDKILPVLHTLRLVGNKPVHYIGLHVNGDWEPIVHGGVYTKLQGGIQLASRSTALNELEYSELVTRLRIVADDIGAEPEIPDMIEVMAEARNLHRFVAGHDAQLGVNLHSNGAPWAITTLLGALERQGFDLRPDGRFVMPDGDGSILFSLSTNATLGEETTLLLTLLLDVPCVAPARDGFGAMVACAKVLMARLDASIVDDGNELLSDAALLEIAGQVRDFYAEMDAADIAAGSNRALRLFS
ncbi:MAG: FtsZ-interacting cell division protein ZipA [Janthinobacterium sp.]|jgi:FtsZ-interacting cell division protein ZipA